MNNFVTSLQAIHRIVAQRVPFKDHAAIHKQIDDFQNKELPMDLQMLMRGLSLIPYIVAGVQHIHGDAKSGVEKKQLAMEALNLAVFGATVVDPSQSQAIGIAQQVFSTAIDGAKAVYNAGQNPAALPSAPAGNANAAQ